MSSLNVRTARTSEYAAIADLTVTAYDALETNHSYAHQEYLPILRDVAGRAKDADVLVAIEDDGTVLGAVTLVLDSTSASAEWDDPHAAGFRMLAVALDARGRGIGRLLTQNCIDRAKAAGKHSLQIHSRDVMQSARRIYASMGFVRFPEIDFQVEEIKLEGFRLDL